MPKASSHLPEGFSTLSIHLTVNGAAKYIEFLKQAFDAVELTRSASPDGRLLNASVRIGDSVMMLNDVFPEFGAKPIAPGDWPIRLTLYLPDADAAWTKSLKAGCQSRRAGPTSYVAECALVRSCAHSSSTETF